MVDFGSMMATLTASGFDTFVLPWILFLVIIYAVVLNAPFHQDDPKQKKQISVIIAAIISFFIINFEWQGQLVGEFLTQMFGSMSLYLAGILVAILFLGMGNWSIKGDDNKSGINSFVVAGLALIAIMIFFNTGSAAYFNIDDETATWIFMLFLVGGALYFLGQGDGK